MRVVFLGPPGAGKGTQARILQERFGLGQISTGDLLRRHLARETELGKQAEDYMHRGQLVPDDLVIDMIAHELERATDGFVMDGFPRTVAQAEALDRLLAAYCTPLEAAVSFTGKRSVLVERLASRWTNPRNGRTYNVLTNPPKVAGIDDEDGGELIQREDDRADTVAKRLDVYDLQTRPLVEYYRKAGKLVEIDALKSVKFVADRIASGIGAEHASKGR
ncbi:MAG TPA: adenylate kinase [Candidatus Dormibacteraeota bacterium]|nr:adenylate kinase [Candidatus Dormibacteraeota bacterium]